MVDKKIEERKRLIFLGLHREPINLRDKKFALFTEAAGAFRSPEGVKMQNVFPFRSYKPGQISEFREPLCSKGSA